MAKSSRSATSATRTECQPRIATQRDLSRKTIGRKFGKVSAALGQPFMPWQQHVADIAGEIDPDTGALWYREVCLLVPRQSGKTTLIRAKSVHRCVAYAEPQRSIYTAQTRNKAREKWEEDFVQTLNRSPFAGMYRVRLAAGSEAIRWNNGSRLAIDAVTKTAGHGDTIDDGTIDEAFAQVDDRTEQAMRPAMITRPNAQLWVVSTAGTAESRYLKRKVDDGRARVLSDVKSRIAYIEYSAPDDADLADPATWWACMPALGHTVTEATVQAELEGMLIDEFGRAYANQWRANLAPAQIIPVESWGGCEVDGDAVARSGEPMWAIDTAPDREWSAIAAAQSATVPGSATERRYVEALDHELGTAWVVPRLVQLRERNGGKKVALDGGGAAASLIPDLEAAGFEVVSASSRQRAAACGAFFDDAIAGLIAHLGDPVLDDALRGAARRFVGDTWVWARGKSLTDITALYAATFARWALVEFAVPFVHASKAMY